MTSAMAIVEEAQCKGDLIGVRMSLSDDDESQDPWTLPPSRRRAEHPIEGPFPESVDVTRANLVYIEKQGLPPAMINRILRIAAFQNPEFLQRAGYAAFHFWQASNHCVRRGFYKPHRGAARLH